MRSLIGLGLSVFIFGCGSDGAAPNGHLDAGATGLDAHLAAAGSCATACDCQPGIGCQNGTCGGSAPIYCCESATCPSQANCQSMSGTMSTCVSSSNGANGSTGSTSSSTGSTGSTTGASGGIIGGLSGFGGGGDGGIIGGLSGSSGGLSGFGGGGDGGIIGGLSGATGTGGFCSFISCSSDSDCTQLSCTSCGVSGTCQ